MSNTSTSVLNLELSNHDQKFSHSLDNLLHQYLNREKLNKYLEDFPSQLENPQSRPWQPIAWQQISSKELINLDLSLFIDILTGIINTEAPIRSYTQASRQYLEKINPSLAKFVGGIVTEDGNLAELGLWEKEERQHAPALMKVYQQLTGQKFIIQSPHVRPYQPTGNAEEDLYRHGLHRIITEYSAVCLYLWLMTHTTGELQQVFGELVEDELNHTIKFWAMGIWLFPQKDLHPISTILTQIFNNHKFTPLKQDQSSQNLLKTFTEMMEILHWQRWTWGHKRELISLFIRIMIQIFYWYKNLNSDYLEQIFSNCNQDIINNQ